MAPKTKLLAEKAALRTAAAAGFPADPDASECQAAVSSLRDQLAELRETKAELECHVDGLNAKIIALSDKHGREAAELRAELAASREVRKADRLADEQYLERQTETLRFAQATIKSLAAELAAVYADRSAHEECGKPLADALRAAQTTVETLEAGLTAREADRQAREPSRAKESQYQELLSRKAALAEDLRIDQIKGLEEHSDKVDILTSARDAAESATAALATEAGELRSELERVKAEYQSAKAELTEQVQVLSNEKATLVDNLRSSDAAESAIAALATEAEELRSELERVKAEYQSAKAEFTEQVQVLSDEKATLLDNLRSSDAAESATAALATEAEELRSELERVKADYQSAKAELTEQVQILSDDKATLLNHLRSSQEKIESLEEDHISQIDALICAREKAESSTSTLETEVGELKAELERVKANFESGTTELTEQVRLLVNDKRTLLEDVRLCREGVKLLEEERSSQLDGVTRARDATESATAAHMMEAAKLRAEVEHVMAYLELVISGCERDTATKTATETVDVRSVASLLVDGVEDGDVWEPSAALRRIADNFRSVHEERDELKARVEKLSADLAETAGDGKRRAAEGCRAATEEAERLLSDNATLTAATVGAESSHRAPQHERPEGGNVTANGLLMTDHAEKVEQLEIRISELKAELETRREMEAKVQSAKAALAEAEAALAAETRRATKMEKRLKCKDEQVKSLESAMAKMKPPTPPLTNTEAERLFKRELERKEAVIRDLQVRCAEAERRSVQDETAERECVTSAGDEPSLREELEKKQSAIAELQTKVARVIRVHAEDVQSIKSKCRSEIAEERLRTKELLEVARKEYDHLFLRFQTLQSELATAQTSRHDPAPAELPVDFT